MPALAIDPEQAAAAATTLVAGAPITASAVVQRYIDASSSLGAAITMLEHRLAAVDRTVSAHLTSAAIELRSAAEEVRRADR